MPPKNAKEPEIDPATLPQCKTINTILMCLGRKERAQAIIKKIGEKGDKTIGWIKKASVLDHAKQKGIYVDPDSLTDKQKKDQKFMESISTELTPAVLAKSVDSYLNTQNLKVRIEKKTELDKPENQRQDVGNRKYDFIYVMDDFPNQALEFQALATNGQNIDYVFVISPEITWMNAPQLPDQGEIDPDADPQPQDQEIVEFKKLKEKQNFTEDDKNHDQTIIQRISKIQKARQQSPIDSPFRNTVIENIPLILDPYNEEGSTNEGIAQFFQRCSGLILELDEFGEWKKGKKTRQLIKQQKVMKEMKEDEKEEQENKQPEEVEQKKSEKEEIKRKGKGENTLSILLNFVEDIIGDNQNNNLANQEVSFEDFDFNAAAIPPKSQEMKKNVGDKYIGYNQQLKENDRSQFQELVSYLKFPGIDRFQIPQRPPKSQQLRKLHRATLGQFLPENISFEQFQRKMDILTFEEAAKEVDDQRTYNFSDRIYEEHHNRQSLTRVLYQAFLFDQSHMSLKYNANNDKLYLVLVHKNPPRHCTTKKWEANWKVLPNFQNWIRHFKQNEQNFSTNQFYDVDYEKVGHIEEKVQVYSTKERGLILRKLLHVGNCSTPLLYGLTESCIFGIKNKTFFCENQAVKVFHKQQAQNTYSTFITFDDQTVIQLQSNGDILTHKPQEHTRLTTSSGYTIIYGDQQAIFHPNGSISKPPTQYVNANGKGLKNNRIYEVLCLKRRTSDDLLVTKRDDGCVIVEDPKQAKKWIQFNEGTEYLQQRGTISIEKENYPLIKCAPNTGEITYHGIRIVSQRISDEQYNYTIQFTDRSSITANQSLVKVTQTNTSEFSCSIAEEWVSKKWDDEEIKVWENGQSELKRRNKIVDPLEKEENYTEEDIITPDYLEPRLFMINSNNTGIELLSHMQIEKYLNLQKQNPQSLMEQQNDHLHILNILSNEEEKKVLDPGFNIHLDIFKKQQKIKSVSSDNTIKMRSFVKRRQVTGDDRHLISQIMHQSEQWRKKTQKDQNQYGHKSRDDPQTQQRINSKNLVSKYRKYPEPHLLSSQLQSQAQNCYLEDKSQKEKEENKKRQEQELRKHMNRKKIEQTGYLWKEPPYREEDQNQTYYKEQSFFENYFLTVEGQKALKGMPDWIFRPKEKKNKQQLDPEIISELNATANQLNQTKNAQRREITQQQPMERKNTGEVNIEPHTQLQQVLIKPSVFTQRQIDEERLAFESEKKAYEYHEMKRKQYNIYGQERRKRPQPSVLQRTQPSSELNQKYLVTEAPVDKKVKISSMKDRLTSGASNMMEMRKEGPHANLLRTLDKRFQYSKLLEKRTMMVQADLNDKLQRDILIHPIEANFGTLIEGSHYQLKIQLKNQDVLSQRVSIKPPKSIFSSAKMNQMGPIALGMTRKISVIVKASPEIGGKLLDEFDIVTKHEIYHIPIQATILTKAQFDSNKCRIQACVRELSQSTPKSNKKQQLPPINK